MRGRFIDRPSCTTPDPETRPRGSEAAELELWPAVRKRKAPIGSAPAATECAAASSIEWHRSERQLIEQLNFNLLFRSFVGLSPDDPVWDATTFTKNRSCFKVARFLRSSSTTLLRNRRSY